MSNYVTDEQIKALATEAADFGDDMQVLICTVAIEGAIDSYEDRFGGGGHRVTRDQIERLEAMTQDDARAECARVIDYARAERAREIEED